MVKCGVTSARWAGTVGEGSVVGATVAAAVLNALATRLAGGIFCGLLHDQQLQQFAQHCIAGRLHGWLGLVHKGHLAGGVIGSSSSLLL